MPTGIRPPIGLPRRNPTHCGAGVTADVSELTIDELAPMIEGRSLSARELTDACLQRIDERDGAINAFITIDANSGMGYYFSSIGQIRIIDKSRGSIRQGNH